MKAIYIIISILMPFQVFAQNVHLRGIVQDMEGRDLPFAYVIVRPDSIVTHTETNGEFRVTTKAGTIEILITFMGFQAFRDNMNLSSDTTVLFKLKPAAKELNEVVITAQNTYQADNFASARSGNNTLSPKDINAITVLGGEADIIKVLQLLPGTVKGIEGSSDLFVRGGAADQNLVLLDDVPVYNTTHLFGFLSVFNPDIMHKVESVNGGFPAKYGGRLSSVIDVQSLSRLTDKTQVAGDIGLLSSRLFIEQPLIKEKAAIWVAGRRTYVDKVMKAAGEELPYFFYDLNGKLILQPTANDKVELNYYKGEDVLDLLRDRDGDGDGSRTSFITGNDIQSFRWEHSGSSGWKGTLSAMRSTYEYDISNEFGENSLFVTSEITDIGAKLTAEKTSMDNSISTLAGVDWIRHRISPNVINTSGIIAQFLESSSSKARIADEYAVHLQHERPLNPDFRINVGLRSSIAVIKNKVYLNPEPRVAIRYSLGGDAAVKLSYSRMSQYLHRISNSAVSSPVDLWYPVTDEIVPQRAHQITGAFQSFLLSRRVFVSIEGYYKRMDHLVGYEEGTNLFLNTDFESKLIQGNGKATGLEFLIRKETGKLTGWISYTLSSSTRQFEEVNEGKWFRSRYDRRHNGAIVIQYALSNRWVISAVGEYISGARFTPVIGQYAILSPTLTGIDLVSVYAPINSVKLADTHRVDLGLKLRSKPQKRFQWEWFAGVYNVYNRANPYGIVITQENGELRYEQPGLFGLIPFISYGFKF